MKQAPLSLLLPPRLTMDAYAELVAETVRAAGAARIARQKAIEERVLKPFRFPDDIADAGSPPDTRRPVARGRSG
jgi:hypothetical protein